MGFDISKFQAKKEEILKAFTPVELTESFVQSIFNRCLAKENTTEVAFATLFPTALGYQSGSEKLIQFDKEILLKNKMIYHRRHKQYITVHNCCQLFYTVYF